MAPISARPLLALLLTLVNLLIPGPCEGQVSIFPKEAFLPQGATLQVNCSTSCNQNFTLGLETQLPKTQLARGDTWTLFELTVNREHSSPMCFSNCGAVQTSASTNITMYSFPESVELDLLPRWQQVGKNFSLRCQVRGGAPRAQFSAVLLHGEEELSRQPVTGDLKDLAEITVTILARRVHHQANFSCRTELDLRPQGLSLFQNNSESRQLHTFELPGTLPKLDAPRLLEVGTRSRVLCSLQDLFPASKARVHLQLGGRTLNSTTIEGTDSVSATAWLEVSAELEGTQQLRCAVELLERTLEAWENLTVYSFPAPTLTLREPEVSEGDAVTLQCEAHGASLVVMLSSAPAGPPDREIQFTLQARAEDDKRRFFCSAALEVDEQVLLKNVSTELRVLYGPRLDKRDCLGNWTWPEGTQQTLKCQAWGNPLPSLTCIRETDGALLPIGLVKAVKREMNGTYVCRAVSSHRNITRVVFLTVVYHQTNNLVVIISVTLAAIGVLLVIGVYLYNRQRKIKIYKLQKAQEEAAMKLKAQATPP